MILSQAKQLITVSLKPLLPTFAVWLLLFAPAQAATTLKVALKENVKQITVGSSTTAIVRDAAGQPLGKIQGMTALQAAATNGKTVKLAQWKAPQLWIDPKGKGQVWIGDSWYRGETRLINDDSDLTVVNQVDLKDYLYSVVGSEMVASWPLEALKAQAVAARSYALYQQNRSTSRYYDLKSTTASQVYEGISSETRRTHKAVNQTRKQILTYQGNVILAAFHASSGGYTEDVEDVWNRRLPYLRGVKDYDQKAPVYQWQKQLSGQEIGKSWDLKQVNDMIPQQRTPQGRILNLKLIGKDQTKTISGNQFRQKFNLRSTLFEINRKQKGN